MRKWLTKNLLFREKKYILFILFFIIVFGFLLIEPVFAQDISNTIGKGVATVVSWIAWGIVHILGLILTLLIKILVNVAQFNNIINVTAVAKGWVIVRDICNMFFVLILLVIAFATILRYENFSIKRLLPKLVIMAVLINFSRMIFGLIIDFAQVIMLTFVNGFGQNGYGNFVSMFQVQNVLSIWTNTSAEINSWAITGAILAGLLALIITIIVVAVMLAVLIMRVIMLWVYTILSPLIFLGFAFPPLQQYTSNMWRDFVKQVVVGPILAFFIWLALVFAIPSSHDLMNSNNNLAGGVGGEEVCAGINAFFCEGSLQTFLITIALLMGGLMVTQQMGGAIGKAAGRAEGWAKGGLRWGGKKTLGMTRAGAREGWAQAQKTRAGRRIAGYTEKFRSKEGAIAGGAAGAVIGSVVPVVGTIAGGLIGAGLGALSKKKIDRTLKSRRTLKDQKLEGIITDKEGNRFKEVSSLGGFYRINADNKFTNKDKPDEEISEEAIKSVGEQIIQDTGTRLQGVKPMSEKQKDAWAQYSSVKSPGLAAKEATTDEKIGKLQNNYNRQSKEMLGRLLNTEKNEMKRMAVAMTLAVKSGFKDAAGVIQAKEALGGNSLLLKKFNDEMNKRNMVLNNTRQDGSLDTDRIAELISSGKAKWEDQDWKHMTKDSVDLMAKQLDVKFHKALETSIKTDKDKERAKIVLGEELTKREFKGNDLNIRKSYGSLTGDFLQAYNIQKGEAFDMGKENVKSLRDSLHKVPKAEVFGQVSEENMNDTLFQQAFADAADMSMLKKINNSNDISTDYIKKYMDMAARHNENLHAKMASDNDLKSYA